ncbi:MAG TPA: glycosyltransferase, partial [Anaerolineae bacterium]|nr:glycosyltransferase [Anaerolineae bacterium]
AIGHEADRPILDDVADERAATPTHAATLAVPDVAEVRAHVDRLRQQLAQADLTEYVRFTGWLPVDQLAAHFQAANVAVFPYDDTVINRTKCSVKLIDLLLAGLPVVADAVGQNREYIQAGMSGVLVPAEDDAAFAGALVDLLGDPAQQRRLGQAAAAYIRQNYDWSDLASIVERAYQA